MTLDRPINGWWDGGPRSTFDFWFTPDPNGKTGRVGSWEANWYRQVKIQRTEKATLAIVRQILSRTCRRDGIGVSWEYIETH